MTESSVPAANRCIQPYAYPAPSKEAHHTKPRYLIGLHDAAHTLNGLDSGDLAAWVEWECEALHYGIDPDNTTREMLTKLVANSVIYLDRNAHREHHTANGDFAQWGRRGGLTTLRRYGSRWFVLLAHRRWDRITAEELATYMQE